MNRNELMTELRTRYPFEKAHSIVQFATEDREYENKDVCITMTRTLDGDIFALQWKPILEFIPDWPNKNLRCHFCGETRSVKYMKTVFDPAVDAHNWTKVCVCNKCAALSIGDKCLYEGENEICKKGVSSTGKCKKPCSHFEMCWVR